MNRVTGCVICLLFLLRLTSTTYAQSLLTAGEVLNAIAENNFDLKVARQNISSTEILTTRENRGYLPTLSLNGGLGYNLNGVKTVYNFNFPDLNIQNIQAYNANIGVSSSYLLYDGGQRRLRNDMNLANLDIANLQLDNIQQLLGFNALQVYYSIAQAVYNVDLLKESMAISKERYNRATTYYQYGNNNKVDVLNAEIDVSRDSVSLITAENDIRNLQLQLNQLTLISDTNYKVDTAFTLEYELSNIEELQAILLSSNRELIALSKQAELVQYDVAIANKLNAPQVIANGAYNLNYQKNSSKSQLDLNRTNGLNLGISANWNILDGGQQKIQEQLAAIDQNNALLELRSKENELSMQLYRLWNTYQNNLQNIRIEQNNIKTS